MVLCVLATDEEDEDDIALQIHFTLLQAFCCDNDVNILRLSGMRRLTQLLEHDPGAGTEPRDLHCILVTVSLDSAAAAEAEPRTHPCVCASAEPARAAAVSGPAARQQLLPGEPRSEPVGSLSGAAGPLSTTGSAGRESREA